MNIQKKLFLSLGLFLFSLPAWAQPIGLRANTMTGIKRGDQTLQYLEGNVSFSQNGSTVMCDNAEYDNGSKTLFGRGNVRIFSNDGANITGSTLTYNDNSKVARVEGNVQLNDGSMVLNAPYLVYNTASKVGYYGGGGRIIDGGQTLTSSTGSYNSGAKTIYFKGNVVLTDPKYVLKADTLQYKTNTKTAYFYSYTEITDGKAKIFCNNGWYQTQTGKAFLTRGAAIYQEAQVIKADTLTYDRETGIGKAFGNLWVRDTVEHMTIFGQNGYYNQKLGYTRVVKKALVQRIDDGEDTLYMRADTFIYISDSATKRRNLTAMGTVRIWQPAFSGFCDSLQYGMTDSLLRLYGKPVLYNENTQLTSDSMKMEMRNNRLKTMWMYKNAMNIVEEDTGHYSQIMGDNITNYFADNDRSLRESRVVGNTQSIYFIREKDSVISSVNKVSAAEMRIVMQDGKVGRIKMYNKPKGKVYPIDQFPVAEGKLSAFAWKPEAKPLSTEFKAPYPEPIILLKKRK
jgi:lipopolysaccharide export system protein LptA